MVSVVLGARATGSIETPALSDEPADLRTIEGNVARREIGIVLAPSWAIAVRCGQTARFSACAAVFPQFINVETIEYHAGVPPLFVARSSRPFQTVVFGDEALVAGNREFAIVASRHAGRDARRIVLRGITNHIAAARIVRTA